MKRIPSRVVIYPRDVEHIMGRHPRTAHRILQRIRKHLHRNSKKPVTVREFCSYFDMDEEIVRGFLD